MDKEEEKTSSDKEKSIPKTRASRSASKRNTRSRSKTDKDDCIDENGDQDCSVKDEEGEGTVKERKSKRMLSEDEYSPDEDMSDAKDTPKSTQKTKKRKKNSAGTPSSRKKAVSEARERKI